jgi:tetratricopeptide (TPR) repeat protein
MSRPSFRPRWITLLVVLLFGPLPLSAQQNAEEQAFYEAESYYATGIKQTDRFEKGRYMSYVIGLYNDYLAKYAGSRNEVTARFHLGYAHQTLGQIEEARQTYRFIISRHRRGAYVGSAARQLAYLAFVEENWEEAATYFSIAADNLAGENLRHAALFKEVECLLKLDRRAEVAVTLQRILAAPNHPHRDWARFMLAYQYFQEDKFEATIGTLKPLLEEEPRGNYYSQALFYSGLASAELGLEDAQDSHLRTILNMSVRDPALTPEERRHLATNKARAQTSLMGLYAKRKDWDEVIRLYEKGDFGASGKIEARRSLRAGKAYLLRERYREARACYRRVDRALPKSETAFLASFQCLTCDFRLGHPGLVERVDVFLEIYQDDFSKHPFLQQARFLKGETLFQRGQMEEAARAFNPIDRDLLDLPLQQELLIKHGWALGESGQFDGAIRSFSRFLADFPDHPQRAEVHNKRAEAHLALGDHLSALRDFEAVLALETTRENTSFALQGSARSLRLEKQFAEMIARFRRLLTDFPDLSRATLANANYRIGWGYHKIEEHEKAPPYLRKARDLVPEFYSQPVGDLLILGAFARRDQVALHTALQEVFQQAPAKMIPRHMLSWLGVRLFHEGRTEDAVFYLERATDPEVPCNTDVGVWRLLAKAQNKSGSFQNAEVTSLLLLDLEEAPKWRADAFLDLAEARLGLQKYDEALKAANEGLALEEAGSHIAGLHLIRGEVALAREDWTMALEEFQTTIPMVPDDPILQPRALHGAQRAARGAGNDTRSQEFASLLRQKFPSWSPEK